MRRNTSSGFSLLEMMIVLIVLLIITGAVFQVISLTTERSSAEQTKLDMFQEAREFMDQMARDLRQAGFPNQRNFAPTLLITPTANDHRVAVGLVKIASGELWFEADVKGTGTVSVIRYYLDSAGTGCPCLKRSEVDKIDGNPYMEQSSAEYQLEVQGVTNTNIFTAYNSAVIQTLPLDFNSDAAAIAGLDTIQAILSLQGATIDPKTHRKPTTTLAATVKLNNCSAAFSARQLSCY